MWNHGAMGSVSSTTGLMCWTGKEGGVVGVFSPLIGVFIGCLSIFWFHQFSGMNFRAQFQIYWVGTSLFSGGAVPKTSCLLMLFSFCSLAGTEKRMGVVVSLLVSAWYK